MKTDSIFPYYYPTTVFIVDDEREFLRHFSLILDADLAYQLYTSPTKALNQINEQIPFYPSEKFMEEHSDSSKLPGKNPLFEIKFSSFSQVVLNLKRYEEVSVVIVDYDMPNKNGLEFCQSLNKTNIKKILLTGVADHKTAIKAFNEGIIDQFFFKNEPDLEKTINHQVKNLQKTYFSETTKTLKMIFSLPEWRFLSDPQFVPLFHELCLENSIVEYYLMTKPKGFLLVNKNGNLKYLLVQTKENLKEHEEIAQCEAAPPDLIDKIKSNQWIPLFNTNSSFFEENINKDDYEFFPAKNIVGDENIFYSFLNHLSNKQDNPEINVNYKQHLNQLYKKGLNTNPS